MTFGSNIECNMNPYYQFSIIYLTLAIKSNEYVLDLKKKIFIRFRF